MHWASQYIGLKHLKGGRSPEGVDCWGLVRLIYEEQFGIELPRYPGITASALQDIADAIANEEKHDWSQIFAPFDGCAVGMSQSTIIHHVGVYVNCNGGKIVHCWEDHNVVAETVQRIKLKGFQTINFYQHILWPTSSRSQTPISPPKTSASTGSKMQ